MTTYLKTLTLSSIALAFTSALLVNPVSAQEPATTQAAEFDLPGKQANVKLSASKGKLVYLDFWASWCGPCKQSFPWMNAMQEKYKTQGFEIIGVNLDSDTKDAQKFLASTPANFTVAFDDKGNTPKAYNVKGMPTSFLIDQDGKVIYQHTGFNAADRDKLEQKIKDSLKATTKASLEDKK